MSEPDPPPASSPTSSNRAEGEGAKHPLGQPVEQVSAWFDEMEVGAPTGPAERPLMRSRSRSSKSKRSRSAKSAPSSRSSSQSKATEAANALPPSRQDANDRPSSRASTSGVADALTWGLAALAAVIALFADGHPTVYPSLDAVLRAGFALGVTLAAAWGRRWSWLVLAGVTAAAAHDVVSAVPAWSALAVAFAAVAFDFRRRWVGAIVGLLASVALLHLPPFGPHGLTVLVGTAATVPVFASAYRRQHRRTRSRIRIASLATIGVLAVMVLGLGIAVLLNVSKVNTGIAETHAGVASAKAGDDQATTQHLQTAVDELNSASAGFHAWYAAPARLVPIVSYQAVALAQMSDTSRDLAVTASDTAATANYHSIAVNDGRIDTDKIAALGPPLKTVGAALDRAEADTRSIDTAWLAPPLLAKLDDLKRAVDDASDQTTTASDAIAVAPAMLGADGPRRYFIAFTTPAESRGLGGFMGNWAELTADHGKLELTRTGRTAELTPAPGDPPRTLVAPAEYLTRYGPMLPEQYVGDATFSPDFPSDAQALASIYAQARGGRPVDGVFAMDPYTLAAMLQITGPITVPGLPEPLDSANAADFLLRRQYLTFDQYNDRVDVLDEAARRTFDAFLHAKSLRPAQLAAVLGPMVEQRRLLAWSTRPPEQELIDRIGLDGSFPARDQGDFFSLVTQNGGNNKIDVYLKRDIDYQAAFAPESGKITATATVTLHNDAPLSGLPGYVLANRPSAKQPDGTNWVWFNFYSPHQLESATLDGKPFDVGVQREFGLQVYQAFLPVPSQGTAQIELHLSGAIAPGNSYDVSWYQQPTVNTDHVRVSLRPVPPWTPSGHDAGRANLTEAIRTTDSRTDEKVHIDLDPWLP